MLSNLVQAREMIKEQAARIAELEKPDITAEARIMKELFKELDSAITFEMYENGADDKQLLKVVKILIEKYLTKPITAE